MSEMNWEKFESMKPEEQTVLFRQSPLKERGEILLHSHRPEALVRALSHEELYLITKDMEFDERGEILKYAGLPQLVFIADMECWKKDRMDGPGFLRWIETLKTAGDRSLLAWILEMDYEAVVTGFKKIIRVLKPEWEYAADELLGDTPYFTLDNFYYVSVEEENLGIVRQTIEILFENDRGRYTALMEGIISDLDDDTEETAYRQRGIRLSERGFPEEEVAFKIYKRISAKEFEEFPKKSGLKSEDSEAKPILPNYPVLWAKKDLFLDHVLEHLRHAPPQVSEGIQEELAWLSNKVIACHGIDFTSEEVVAWGVARARFFVSIGLEILSKNDVLKAVVILKERWLEAIFRVAYTVIGELKEASFEITRAYWGGAQEAFVRFLSPPYDFIFRGIFRQIPECYDPTSSDTLDPVRDFSTFEEVEKTRLAIQQIAKVHDCFLAESPRAFKAIADQSFEPSLFSVLGAGFVWFVIAERLQLKPASAAGLQQFIEKGFELKGSRRELSETLKQAFLEKWFNREDRDLMKPFWALLFHGIEEDFLKIDLSGKKLDARFISSIWLAEGSARKKTKKTGPEKSR